MRKTRDANKRTSCARKWRPGHYGSWLTQLVITNTTIVAYIVTMLVLKQYVPTEVLITWLSSTIVEIIGILWVIARSLFPFHDRHRDTKGEKHKS